MPVLLGIPPDPTDAVWVQGEQLRIDAMAQWPQSQSQWPMIDDDVLIDIPLSPSVVIAGWQTNQPMQDASTCGVHARLRAIEAGNMVTENSVLATPAGALIPMPIGYRCLWRMFVQDSSTFAIAGTTKTGAGAALGNCRVVVMETGRIGVPSLPASTWWSAGNPQEVAWESESPVAAEAISDGSGVFSIAVPLNTAYQLTAYLSGAPDRAGLTRNDVVPTTGLSIYLRDPTAADVGGSASYRPVGSAVVRRLDK